MNHVNAMTRYLPSRRDAFMFVLGAGITAILGVGLGAQNIVSKALTLTKDFSGPIAVKTTPLDGQTIELRMPTAQQIQDLHHRPSGE